jgi:hypothetical protein
VPGDRDKAFELLLPLERRLSGSRQPVELEQAECHGPRTIRLSRELPSLLFLSGEAL